MVSPEDVEGIAESGDEVGVAAPPAQVGGVDFAGQGGVELVAVPADLEPLDGRDGMKVGVLGEGVAGGDGVTELFRVALDDFVASR